MSKLVKLHNAAGEAILLNMDNVMYMHSTNDNTTIATMVDGKEVNIRESLNDIARGTNTQISIY